MTPPTTPQSPPPSQSAKHWPTKLYVANASSVYVRTVDADKEEVAVMTQQVVVQKPRPKPVVRRDRRVLCIINGIPKIVKLSVLKAYKQRRAATTPTRETKVNLDQHDKRGKSLVISSSSGKIILSSSKTVACNLNEAKKNTLKMRREFFIHRCFLHVLNFGLQTGNLAGLHDVLGSIETSDLQLKKLLAMKFRYFTTWVVMLHIFYSASALVVLYRQNERFKKGKTAPIVILKPKLKFSLEGIFRGILWPSSLVVTIFFWTLFNYDRDLIFPKFFDEVICSGSNHIIHTWITIFVFLEVLFNPRLRPVNHTKYLRVMFIFLAVYLSVFYYTLLTEDIWLYPIFSVAYNGGIMYFLLLHLMLLVLFLISYVLLWKVNDRFHEHRQFLMKKTRFFSIRWGTPAIKE